MEKICLQCEESLSVSLFTKRSNRVKNDYQPRCNNCRSKLRREQARRVKAEAIQYKGGVCNDCLQIVHQAAFEFHHIDPSTKEVIRGNGKVRKEPTHFLQDSKHGLSNSAKEELDKCVLLCANCHRVRRFSDII